MERDGLDAGLTIGIWPNPENSIIWPDVVRLLQPAANRDDGRVSIEDHAELWTVHRGRDLIGAATVRLKTDGAAEFHLVGGVDARAWWKPLGDMVGRWAIDEGCDRLTAYGRKGWRKLLDWDVVGERDGMTMYLKKLA